MDKKISPRAIAVVAVMAALSTVLQILEFSVPLVPSFLKFDFSDLPALVTSFALSPLAGVTVALVKNLLHLPFSQTGGVGELANFLVAVSLVVPAGWIYRLRRDKKGAILGSVVGALFMAAISFPVNLFIAYPVYAKVMPMDAIISMYHAIYAGIDSLEKALLFVNIPFTLVKGALCALITFLIYKPLSPILKGKKK